MIESSLFQFPKIKRVRLLGLTVFSLITMMTVLVQPTASAFSMKPQKRNNNRGKVGSSLLKGKPASEKRRDLLKSPLVIGSAVIYTKLVSDVAVKLTRGDQVYPKAHESRVEEVFAKATVASIPKSMDNSNRPLRVLEMGIGSKWRVVNRGLYNSALDELSSKGVSKIELTGIDLSIPSSEAIQELSSRINQYAATNNQQVDINVTKQSIKSRLDFPDGFFDSVVGTLVLCSVDDQDAALQEIKRLTRPNGGTFGYVEHVAVNPDEESIKYRILDWQQKLLDPLQQAVADNCHLHRFTDDNIATKFGIESNTSAKLFSERFLVKDMWPVSCQCCGVVQRISTS